MASIATLRQSLQDQIDSRHLIDVREGLSELTVEIPPQSVVEVCQSLRDGEQTAFEQMIDLCGVDYSTYSEEEPARAWKGKTIFHCLSPAVSASQSSSACQNIS